MLIDTHCHLQFTLYGNDRDEMISRCIQKGLIMNTIGTQLETSKKAVSLAEQYEQVYATVGLHPIQSQKMTVQEEQNLTFIAKGEDFDMAAYDALVRSSDKVVAIGETGLDAFHVPNDMPLDEVFDDQWSLVEKHRELADKHDLPLVFHVRDAHAEMIKRLGEWRHPIRGVVHCFTGNWHEAKAYLDMGLYLGFTGVITFPPKKTNPTPQEELLEVVKNIPMDRVLVETDAPFLAPQAYRGKRCEPWMVEAVVEKIAEVKNVLDDEVRLQSSHNARTLLSNISI